MFIKLVRELALDDLRVTTAAHTLRIRAVFIRSEERKKKKKKKKKKHTHTRTVRMLPFAMQQTVKCSHVEQTPLPICLCVYV